MQLINKLSHIIYHIIIQQQTVNIYNLNFHIYIHIYKIGLHRYTNLPNNKMKNQKTLHHPHPQPHPISHTPNIIPLEQLPPNIHKFQSIKYKIDNHIETGLQSYNRDMGIHVDDGLIRMYTDNVYEEYRIGNPFVNGHKSYNSDQHFYTNSYGKINGRQQYESVYKNSYTNFYQQAKKCIKIAKKYNNRRQHENQQELQQSQNQIDYNNNKNNNQMDIRTNAHTITNTNTSKKIKSVSFSSSKIDKLKNTNFLASSTKKSLKRDQDKLINKLTPIKIPICLRKNGNSALRTHFRSKTGLSGLTGNTKSHTHTHTNSHNHNHNQSQIIPKQNSISALYSKQSSLLSSQLQTSIGNNLQFNNNNNPNSHISLQHKTDHNISIQQFYADSMNSTNINASPQAKRPNIQKCPTMTQISNHIHSHPYQLKDININKNHTQIPNPDHYVLPPAYLQRSTQTIQFLYCPICQQQIQQNSIKQHEGQCRELKKLYSFDRNQLIKYINWKIQHHLASVYSMLKSPTKSKTNNSNKAKNNTKILDMQDGSSKQNQSYNANRIDKCDKSVIQNQNLNKIINNNNDNHNYVSIVVQNCSESIKKILWFQTMKDKLLTKLQQIDNKNIYQNQQQSHYQQFNIDIQNAEC